MKPLLTTDKEIKRNESKISCYGVHADPKNFRRRNPTLWKSKLSTKRKTSPIINLQRNKKKLKLCTVELMTETSTIQHHNKIIRSRNRVSLKYNKNNTHQKLQHLTKLYFSDSSHFAK